MKRKPLPPLEVGTAYVAADFERFEYWKPSQSDTEAILLLHLKNGTTIDLPCSHADMRNLAIVLAEAYGPEVVAHLKMRGWV